MPDEDGVRGEEGEEAELDAVEGGGYRGELRGSHAGVAGRMVSRESWGRWGVVTV